MRFVYKPEGADPRSWEFDPNKLMNAEAEVIERRTGMTFGEWTHKVRSGSVLALHGLLFVMLKREIHTLKWDDVQFCLDELDFEIDDADAEAAIHNLEQEKAERGELSDFDEQLLEDLRAQYEQKHVDEAPEGPAPTEGDAGPKGSTEQPSA